MSTPQEEGFEFENDLAKSFGVPTTPGSGNQWFSKLDLGGKGVRVSAKASRTKVVVDDDLINEALAGCDDGTIPLWAIRIPSGDFIMLSLDDFKGFVSGEIEFDIPYSKREERKARAHTPQLFRDS